MELVAIINLDKLIFRVDEISRIREEKVQKKEKIRQ